MIRYLLHHTSWMVSQLVKGRVALDRFDAFLRNTELIDEFDGAIEPQPQDASGYEVDPENDNIELEDIAFVWSNDDVSGADGHFTSHFELRIRECLRFKSGAINLIVGPTYVS